MLLETIKYIIDITVIIITIIIRNTINITTTPLFLLYRTYNLNTNFIYIKYINRNLKGPRGHDVLNARYINKT